MWEIQFSKSVCYLVVPGGTGRHQQHAEDGGVGRGARRLHDRGVRRDRQDRGAAEPREGRDIQDGLRHY